MNKIAKNAAWIIACNVVKSLVTLVVGMLTARYLGPANYGLISYASSLVAFAVPIMQLGLSNILVRELVDHPEHEGETLGTSLVLSGLSALVCILLVCLFAAVFNANEPVTIRVCFLYSLILLVQALEIISYWFQAKLLSKYSSTVGLIAYILVSAYKIYLLAARKSIYWFALSNVLDTGIIAFASLAIYRRLGGQRLRFSAQTGKQMFSKSRYYIISSMMVTVFAYTDKIMLKLMMDEAATGYYSAALAIANILTFVYGAIIDSFRPSIFAAKNDSEQGFEHRLAMLYCLIIYLSLAICAGLTLFSKLAVRILYGVQYMPAASTLRIVVWYTTFSYLGVIRNIWILANNQQKHLWIINLSGALANVVLNTLLIPAMGVNGAALASLVTQFFTNVLVGYLLMPIRDNNRIMLLGCNPTYLKEAFLHLRKRES